MLDQLGPRIALYSGNDPNARKHKARIVLFFSVYFAALSLLLGLLSVSLNDARDLSFFYSALFAFVYNCISAGLSRTRIWRSGGGMLCAFTLTMGLLSINAGVQIDLVLVALLPILLADYVFGILGLVSAFIFYAVSRVLLTLVQQNGIAPLPTGSTTLGTAINAAVLAASLIMIMAYVFEQLRVREYAGRLLAQLRATAQVGQAATSVLDLNELLIRAVDNIRTSFGFYHVQVFLLDDDRRYANLAASTGEAGRELLRRKHRLAVGSQSIIGRATLTGEPTLTIDTTGDPLHHKNDLLPETRSELALPLIVGDQLLGALDVQSTHPDAFAQEDIDSLQIMASQVSIAIRNAQLFEEQKRASVENRRLFLEAETNLREIQRLNQRLTGGAWDEYVRTRKHGVLGVTLNEGALADDAGWTRSLTQAIRKGRPLVTHRDGRRVVTVPVELRGQILGAIEVELPADAPQSEIMETVQAVSSRLALNLDNARLFEDAQRAAQHELEVNTITSRMQSITDVDELLRSTLSELARALNAGSASVRFGAQGSNGRAALQSNGHSNGTEPQ